MEIDAVHYRGMLENRRTNFLLWKSSEYEDVQSILYDLVAALISSNTIWFYNDKFEKSDHFRRSECRIR